MKLNAKELRKTGKEELNEKTNNLPRRPIYFILENIYDTYNIGGLFRLADALNIEKLYICGQSEIPPHHKISKAGIGTDKIVPWEYKKTALEAISDLRKGHGNKVKIFAVEQTEESVDYKDENYETPLALIFGNETFGVLKETLDASDKKIFIPMRGVNKSLNVIISAAIVGYFIDSKIED